MEKFAVDLDKVLDEFEFSEDCAEQMATALTKGTISSIPPVVGGALLYQPSSPRYCKPTFETISLADADFAADPQSSTLQYNNMLSSATNYSPGPPIDDANFYVPHSENVHISSDGRVRNNSGADWPQNLASAFHSLNVSERRDNLLAQNANYSDGIHVHRNVDSGDLQWQQDAVHNRAGASAANKLNVSGVFSSLNEYLNAGKIETKVGDVNIVNNQTSWNVARHLPAETEENGNYAINYTDTSLVVDTKGKYEHGSPMLYPSADTEIQTQILSGRNVSDDFQENNHTNDLASTSDQWENTIDVCKRNENCAQISFADLIPISYSRSMQEEANVSGQSVIGDHVSSDETPDLLDTTSNSNKPGSFNNARFSNPQIKDGSHISVLNGDSSTPQFLTAVTSGLDLQNICTDKKAILMVLPDVAASGRNLVESSNIFVSSDLVSSHGSGVLSNEELSGLSSAGLDLVSRKAETDENVATLPPLDSNEIISVEGSVVSNTFKSAVSSSDSAVRAEDISVDMSKEPGKQNFVSTERVAGHLHNASFPYSVESKSSLSSDILSNKDNSEVKERGDTDDVPIKSVPVGFSALDVLSDAELQQCLQELEGNDKEHETDQDGMMESKAKTEIILSSECQDSSDSSSGVNTNEELLAKSYKAESRTDDEYSESLGSTTGIIGIKNETVVEEYFPGDFNKGKSAEICSTADTEVPKCSISSESSVFPQHVSAVSCSPDEQSTTSTTETLSSVTDKHTTNTEEIPIISGFTSINKSKIVSPQSLISGTLTGETITKPITTANTPPSTETVVSDVTSQPVPTMPTATTVTSKTSSVITNLVSIDCQQISESCHQEGLGNDRYVTNGSELCKRVPDVTEDIEAKSDTENPDLTPNEMKSQSREESVCDTEKIESGILPLNEASPTLKNVSSGQETNFDSAENCLSTPEIISFSNEKSSFGKTPSELVSVSENGISQPSSVYSMPKKDTSLKHPDRKTEDSRTVVVGVSEVGFAEVQTCLVRMPRDGTTINVLGEEERPTRPKYLFLPSKITVENEQDDSENSQESPPISEAVGPPGGTPFLEAEAACSEAVDNIPLSSPDISESSSIEQAVLPIPPLQIATPLSDDMSDILSPEERSLGKLPPFWVPDADAPNCMQCEIKFTVLKRRHHCRACGKVLCSKCCSLKSRLEYMDNSEARVCQPCYTTLAKVFLVEQGESASGSPSSLQEGAPTVSSTPLGRQPNPNNPMEYCSTIPPLEQAANVLRQPPPSVLVPVGVLKREGSTRSRSDVAKQVMFSDGIRPGGDLTELDGSSDSRLPYRRPGRVLKRVGTPPGPPTSASNHSSQRLLPPLDPKTMSCIPTDKGLPPIVVINKGEVKFDDVVDHDKQMAILRSETEQPTMFAINRNLFVQVKILNLDCCVNRTCWCFTTCGMSCVGQDEIVIILECLPDESTVPKDIFRHLNTLYQDASRGNTVSELGHTVFQGVPFLDSPEHGGFIYVRPSFQCLQKLILPPSPYLVAVLVHRWETPWATVFPIRLMLRLGAEYRYYPCMLVSVRNRRPVYWEIGHTIINLLADFRNMSYTLPSVRGLVVHMEDRQTSILIPKNRYDQVTRALNNSNDHVLALASNFSFTADSHLVCIQSNRDESYHTQAINIHNKPRKVTGASFVVFNGALKTSSNLTAKSSIVEDGLMVQITPDTMQALRGALRNMQDFCIGCGPAGASEPDELVDLKWVQDDKNFNVGVKSSIDGRALDGVPSIRVHNGTDYMGSWRFIRWTEVFILQSDEGSGRGGDPLDISRLSESLARATCLALVKLLDLLAQAGLTKLAVRATVHPENVGYEAGSKGEKLPPIYMDSLDNELVPILHKAASMSQYSSGAVLELVFHIMLQ